MTEKKDQYSASVWEPLAIFDFRIFWAGMSLSTIAFWMQNIIVTSLMIKWSNSDPLMISLVQTSLFLPVMFLSIPFGIITDSIDRRKFLIFSQCWMLLPPLLISGLIVTGTESPTALLITTTLLATGNAMKLPSQSAFLTSLVPKSLLSFAINLNSMAVNGGRVIGPAIAGVLLPIAGAPVLLIGNSLVYLSYVLILLKIPSPRKQSTPISMTLTRQYLYEIASYVTKTKTFKNTLLRGGLYFCTWSTILAVIPLITKNPNDFGILYGIFGLGAVIGASLYSYLSALSSRSTSLTAAIIMHSFCLALISFTTNFLILSILMSFLGLASFFVMTTLHITAQLQFPDKIRGRGLAFMTTTFMGATALCSPFWGYLTFYFSAPVALQIASIFSLLCGLLLSKKTIGD